jgi:hypothetical protein
MMEAFAQIVGEFLLGCFGYMTGRVVIPFFTFGRVGVELQPTGAAIFPRWGGLHRAPNGQLIMNEEACTLAGIVFWVVVGAISWLVYASI